MPKYDFDNPDDDLAFTIDMALSQLKLLPRKGKTETREQHEQRRMSLTFASAPVMGFEF